ncbi:baseplate multidomain protein megatron [Henriciella marina]|uniref:baseplate multidomain protein megatron n=1 Tax=Henriciella marina TaxID=453851 RepID=UPI000381C4F3|nr:glycoside hydrolase/phage tail family protein [Henriciella marina]
MGQIILSHAGQAVGQAFLPNGLSFLGAEISGAALGGAIGGLAGRAVDAAFQGGIHGPRVSALKLLESREGAGLPLIYGRARVGGQVIWAAQFKEKRRERSAGKGGPKVNDYSYSASFAVAVADGPVSRIGRIWANGEVLELAGLNVRVYRGDESQLPDPLIEAVEGEAGAPAFRGTAYVVFEGLPLDAFGNRLPQLSFEVFRSFEGEGGLRAVVEGLNIIPATGEFVYATDVVRERRFPGIETPLNMNNPVGAPDFVQSLDQLTEEMPNVRRMALTVAWFGDDVRAGHCSIRPGVETRDRVTVPYGWEVAGQTRQSARLISQTDGRPNFGGTPCDRSVRDAIAAMKAEGISVTMSPFLLMDIPQGNDRADPYGSSEQAAFPWRGRLTASVDGASSTRSDVESFVGSDGGFGYRHFILHHARLAVEAGGVDEFLIGSEMVGLTRLRDETGAFPFVEALISLAAEVKAILGDGTRVSYAADWTEYGAYLPEDGSGDVLFPLDALWASQDVDFVGIDWYPPMGDWREGDAHLDALAGFDGPDDKAYLHAQLQGGEAFDWYYSSPEARAAQLRTPITDTAHGEDWIFRQKDIVGWWGNHHHERTGGVRATTPTLWQSEMKPVRLMEVGFPAIDRGTNAPNVFYDPKSSESALPPFSSGARNDVLQRRALEVSIAYWSSQPFIDAAYAWAWDARPWPDFPVREDVWSDGPNWARGHWLNGRTGLVSVSEVIGDLARQAGISIETENLDVLVEGLSIEAPTTLRQIIEPLHALYRFRCFERETGLVISAEAGGSLAMIPFAETVGAGPNVTRLLLDKVPGHLTLSYIDSEHAYAPALVDARTDGGDATYTIRASLPLLMSEAVARRAAEDLLLSEQESERALVEVPPHFWALEPGDVVNVETLGGEWIINDITDDGIGRSLELSRPVKASPILAGSLPEASRPATIPARPEVVIADAPNLAGDEVLGPVVAVSGAPWAGPVILEAGRSVQSLTARGQVAYPAQIGRLTAPLADGPRGRWDEAGVIELLIEAADLSSAEKFDVLAGGNSLLVKGASGWEAIAFRRAELLDENSWQLSGLLRGLQGSPVADAEAGAIVLIVNENLERASVAREEIGAELLWRAGGSDMITYTHFDHAGLPWSVAHLRAAILPSGGRRISWAPCGADIPESWDLPDPVEARRYAVRGLYEGAEIVSFETSETSIVLEDEIDEISVAETGTDGRRGPWVSIATGAL